MILRSGHVEFVIGGFRHLPPLPPPGLNYGTHCDPQLKVLLFLEKRIIGSESWGCSAVPWMWAVVRERLGMPQMVLESSSAECLLVCRFQISMTAAKTPATMGAHAETWSTTSTVTARMGGKERPVTHVSGSSPPSPLPRHPMAVCLL